LAFNTAQVYLMQRGKKIAAKGIRRLRRIYRKELGRTPVIVYYGDKFGVVSVEKLLRLVGLPARQSLLPMVPHGEPP
jgi:hypothetical protein